MKAFTHTTLGQRVLFGWDRAAAALAAEVDRLRSTRVMVLAEPAQMPLARQVCHDVEIAVWHDGVVEHVPLDRARTARETARAHGVDLLVSVGGGSATGLAKAVALTSGIPVVAVPTTYAGSEATDVWGLTEGSVKTTGSDPAVLPVTVVYDGALTVGLPVAVSVASGLNGLAHCVDSLWAPRADPINRALALEGARALTAGLPRVAADPRDRDGREESLYGAYLAAVAFASAGSAMHHKICHVLGGAYDLPHAQTHAVVLPRVLAFNAPAIPPELAARLAGALGRDARPDDAGAAGASVDALADLYTRLDAPRALGDHGMAEADLPDAVTRALPVIPRDNPRPVTPDSLTALLRAAWAGHALPVH